MRVGPRGVLDHRQSADAGSDAYAGAFLVPAVIVEACIRDRFHRRNESEMIEGVVATRLFRRQPFRYVEVFDFPCDLRGKRRRVEPCDARDARATRQNVRPCRGDAYPNRRNDTESGDDDAAGHET